MDDEQASVIIRPVEHRVVIVDMSRDGLHAVSLGERPAAVRAAGVLDSGAEKEKGAE
jgi:hypothetical protein